MLLFLFVLFIVVPLVEISVIVQVSHWIGGWNAIGLIVLISAAGAWLMRHETLVVVGKIREQLDAGRVPNNEMIDGLLVLVGGLMMLTPGFVTDAIGLLLVFPLTRVAVRTVVRRRFAHRFTWVTRVPSTWTRDKRDNPDDVIDV